MTKHTNGQFPFDGDATGNLGMWKETPFLEIITLDNDEYRSDSYLKTWLISLDSGIQTSWQDMVHVEDRVATGGGSAYGPLVEAFLQHVHSLAADPTHLYFVYQEH